MNKLKGFPEKQTYLITLYFHDTHEIWVVPASTTEEAISCAKVASFENNLINKSYKFSLSEVNLWADGYIKSVEINVLNQYNPTLIAEVDDY